MPVDKWGLLSTVVIRFLIFGCQQHSTIDRFATSHHAHEKRVAGWNIVPVQGTRETWRKEASCPSRDADYRKDLERGRESRRQWLVSLCWGTHISKIIRSHDQCQFYFWVNLTRGQKYNKEVFICFRTHWATPPLTSDRGWPRESGPQLRTYPGRILNPSVQHFRTTEYTEQLGGIFWKCTTAGKSQ